MKRVTEFADKYGKTILSVWVDEPSYNGSYLPWTPKLEVVFAERYGYIWQIRSGCSTTMPTAARPCAIIIVC